MSDAPGVSTVWLDHLVRHPGEASCLDAAGAPVDLAAALATGAGRMLEARRLGRKVLGVGNGGSAAIVGHLQTDLCGGLGIRGLVFQDPGLLTALANDHGYENAYRRMVDLWAEPGDLLVAVSSSGRSANILNACAAARARGAWILTLSGFDPDNPLRSAGDLNLHVASHAYGPVETAHAVLLHHLTDLVLARLRAGKEDA